MANVVQCGVATASIEEIPSRGRCVHVWVKDGERKRMTAFNIPVEYAEDVAAAVKGLFPIPDEALTA